MPSKIRVGVIGTGFGALVHIPGFQECTETEVVAVCSARLERAQAVARRFGAPQAYAGYREMLRSAGLDLLSITAPPYEHYPMTMAAIEAGVNVLCEKPLALDAGECREMLRAAEHRGIVHMVCHEFRWSPARAYMARLLQDGYIGRLRNVSLSLFLPSRGGSLANPVYTWAAERARGGGMLMALGSHFIDALLWWFGDVSGVSGKLYALAPERQDPQTGETILANADDAFHFAVQFRGGGWGGMVASMAAPFGRGGRIEAYGTEGTLVSTQVSFNPDAATTRLLGARVGEKELRELPIPAEYAPIPDDPRDARLMPFKLLVDRLVAAIRTGQPASPSFREGLRVQEVLDGVFQSHDTGRWIDVEATDSLFPGSPLRP